jgi:hypothetical protein
VVDWCCMCETNKCGESVDHLLLHYEVARPYGILSLYLWFRVVYASTGGGSICKLERAIL